MPIEEGDEETKAKVMRVIYDAEVDALYIRLLEGDYECRTLRLTDEISLNIGPDEVLVGIEVLDAREGLLVEPGYAEG